MISSLKIKFLNNLHINKETYDEKIKNIITKFFVKIFLNMKKQLEKFRIFTIMITNMIKKIIHCIMVLS